MSRKLRSISARQLPSVPLRSRCVVLCSHRTDQQHVTSNRPNRPTMPGLLASQREMDTSLVITGTGHRSLPKGSAAQDQILRKRNNGDNWEEGSHFRFAVRPIKYVDFSGSSNHPSCFARRPTLSMQQCHSRWFLYCSCTKLRKKQRRSL